MTRFRISGSGRSNNFKNLIFQNYILTFYFFLCFQRVVKNILGHYIIIVYIQGSQSLPQRGKSPPFWKFSPISSPILYFPPFAIFFHCYFSPFAIPPPFAILSYLFTKYIKIAKNLWKCKQKYWIFVEIVAEVINF